jgi:spermidine synthase
MILANWMLLTGLGSFLGKLFENQISKTNFINFGHILMAFLPLIISFMTYYLRSAIYPPGKIINLAEVFFNSFILLSPFCLITGILFPGLASILSSLTKSNVINKAYSIEALGSLIGGVLFNFLLLIVLKTFFSLTILMMINLTAVIINVYLSGKRITSYIIAGLTITLTVIIAFSNLDKRSLQYLYPNQEIAYFKDTPYSKIVVTYTEGQYNFYENGNFLFSEGNTINIEESVHYAMVQHPDPKYVLLISGGISGMINEILKYKIKEIDYVEQNPDLINVGELFTSNILQDSSVHVINMDARQFIKKNSNKKYDVVLINLPDPSSARINRFYTLEFFEELKKDLHENAVISISLTSTSNYLGEESRKINSSVFSTLKLLFENVIIIPGGLNFFIASDEKLSYSIVEQLELRKIKNEYVNRNYLEDKRIEHESNLIGDAISDKVTINTDFKPVVYLYQLQYWMSHFDINYFILISLILFPVLYSFFKLNFINYGVFITGFSASSVEVILIIAFQIIYGYTYQMLGIIITFFMAGLLIGSIFLINKIAIVIKTYSIIQYLIGIYAICLALILYFLRSSSINNFLIHLIFILLISIMGILTGLQFALATRLRSISIPRIAASTYASDLLGAAVGAILIAAFFIPYFGILKVSLIVAILNFITGLFILLKLRKKFS